ncbi:MAG: hypothetical protein D6715_13700, partial [Calditrichaeota bacterium]
MKKGGHLKTHLLSVCTVCGVALMAAVLLIGQLSCSKKHTLGPEKLQQAMAHRNLGLAYLEEDRYQEAVQEFKALAELVPWEPMAYANLGLAYLRQDDYASAEKWLKKVARMAPESPEVQLLLAQLYQITGKGEKALSILNRLISKHPDHPRVLYFLGEYHLQRGDSTSLTRAEIYLGKLVGLLPANLVARLFLLQAQMALGHRADALQNLETLRQILPALSEPARLALERSIQALLSGDLNAARPQVQILHNLLRNLPQYQAGEAELRGSARTAVGLPVQHFLKMKPVSSGQKLITAPPRTVHFQEVTERVGLPGSGTAGRIQRPAALACADFDGDGDVDLLAGLPGKPVQIWQNERGTFKVRPDVGHLAHLKGATLAKFADFDNDGHLDLLVAVQHDLRLLKNDGTGRFVDYTSASQIKLPTSAMVQDALFADLDHEGDLDLLLATNRGVMYFRNDGNGRFSRWDEEAGFQVGPVEATSAAFADLDDDRDTDVVVGNAAGAMLHFDNLRQGFFQEVARHSGLAGAIGVTTLAVADYNNDGYLDLVTASGQPAQPVLFRNQGDGTFVADSSALSKGTGPLLQRVYAIHPFDLDNDGYLDLLLAGQPSPGNTSATGLRVLYNLQGTGFVVAPELLPQLKETVFQVCTPDYDADGDLDIAVLAGHGLHLLRNDGGNVNNYLVVRLTGLRSGSGKNNYFGIGARVEVKAGTLTQVRVMTEPIAHFGLNGYQRADVLRVVWTNGVPQNRFHPEKNQTLVENQILKGSCPWLFAWDGRRFRFVTDVLWASALGMPLGILGTEMHYAFPQAAVEYM